MSALMPTAFIEPPSEFSLIPFWFWNDRLTEQEIIRQMDEFIKSGVHGFVIHPRVGLPRSLAFMSDNLLGFMRFAVEEAAKRGMKVFLYDEGMYPSGSAAGQVATRNPAYQCRGLVKMDLLAEEEPRLRPDENLVAVVRRHNGKYMAVIDRPVKSVIRGLHYIGEGPEEDRPPAADLLNPDAVQSFITLVYERFYSALGTHFGKTIQGIFTDEPTPLGRCRENGVVAGAAGILEHVNRLLGYDFTHYLPCLWHLDEPEASRRARDYHWAIHQRLNETYYKPIQAWCAAHDVAWTGHPQAGSCLAAQRFFDIPGQDMVWRWVLPKEPLGLEGPESTQAKVSSSAMIHYGRRRNVNECFGAYGHNFSWEDMKSLADWCLVRGVNMLTPHAFFYSTRGPRKDERPPDLGPRSALWKRFGDFARYAARLCWLNTDSTHVCRLAILADPDGAPWNAARVCFQNQCDFNYMDPAQLAEEAVLDDEGCRLANMRYSALVVEEGCMLQENVLPALKTLAAGKRLIFWAPNGQKPPVRGMIVSRCADCLIREIRRLTLKEPIVEDAVPDLRARHVLKDGHDYYFFVNEGLEPISFCPQFPKNASVILVNPLTGKESEAARGEDMVLGPYDSVIARITHAGSGVT